MISEQPISLSTTTGTIYGSLVLPAGAASCPVVLIIAGSGPTDRDGNSALIPGKNDSLQLLAHALGKHGIASVRYDKRGVAASRDAVSSEADLRFEDYSHDSVAWVKQLANDYRFRSFVIA